MLDTANWGFAKAVNALGELITIDDYALDNEFTFADVLLAQTIDWADRFKFEVPTNYLEYRDNMMARPVAKAALAKID